MTVILLVLLCNIYFGNSVTCVNTESPIVQGSDAIARANCDLYSGYSLVSCGLVSSGSTGNWEAIFPEIESNIWTCKGRATSNSEPIKVYARCCDLRSGYGINENDVCDIQFSGWSGDDDDQWSRVFCSDNTQILFGCGLNGWYGQNDGVCIGSNSNWGTLSCDAWNNPHSNENNVDYCIAVDGTQNGGGVRPEVCIL